jgi:hypothetical protein
LQKPINRRFARLVALYQFCLELIEHVMKFAALGTHVQFKIGEAIRERGEHFNRHFWCALHIMLTATVPDNALCPTFLVFAELRAQQPSAGISMTFRIGENRRQAFNQFAQVDIFATCTKRRKYEAASSRRWHSARWARISSIGQSANPSR